VRRLLPPLLAILALAAIAAAGWWFKRPAEATAVACPDPVAGCAFVHAGQPARVRFLTPPAALEAFGLVVEAPGARRVSAEFQMVGMDMGFNRYDLRAADGGFAAQVTLPACVSGRRDWVLYLTLDDRRYALPFSAR
jgi:hypothetical protein